MLEQERENLVFQFRKIIEKAITKHRRENPCHPTGTEYAECWAQACMEAAPIMMEPRKKGRPKKVKVEVVPDNAITQ